jgi:hypothetical protein
VCGEALGRAIGASSVQVVGRKRAAALVQSCPSESSAGEPERASHLRNHA